MHGRTARPLGVPHEQPGPTVDGLEVIAEQCRIREPREALGEEIVRRSRAHGLTILPAELDAKADRAMASMEAATVLLAAGRTLEDVARHMAVQHDLNPNRVVELRKDLRIQYGR